MSFSLAISACAAAVSAFSYLAATSSNEKVHVIEDTPTTTIALVQQTLQQHINTTSTTTPTTTTSTTTTTTTTSSPEHKKSHQHALGHYTSPHLYVELKGRTSGRGAYLDSDFAHRPALVVDIRVERIVEELSGVMQFAHDPTDPSGMVLPGGMIPVAPPPIWNWVRRSDVLSQARRSTPIYIDDGTGSIHVLEQDLNLDSLMEESFSRFVPASAVEMPSSFTTQPLTLVFGDFHMTTSYFISDERTRCVGYRFIERILPVDHAVFAVGDAVWVEGEGLILRKPHTRPFVFSLQSEYEVREAANQKSNYLKSVAGLSAFISGLSLAHHCLDRWGREQERLQKLKNGKR